MSSPFVDVEALVEAATTGLRAAFAELRSDHPDETVYGFGFYGHAGEYVTSTAFTEEGLRQVAARYVEMANDGEHEYLREKTLDEHLRSLRWSPADSPRHLIGEAHLEAASDLADEARERCDEAIEDLSDHDEADRLDAARIETVNDSLVEALRRLDAEGVFGPDRDRIVLNVWEGDQSPEDRIALARRCNPPEVAQRFEREELASYD